MKKLIFIFLLGIVGCENVEVDIKYSVVKNGDTLSTNITNNELD